jgi:signal transduction histidine kinase/DNA-binding NarL/FixJ family response regulator
MYSSFKPALIARMYRAIEQDRLSDVMLLMRQIVTHTPHMTKLSGEEILRELRYRGDVHVKRQEWREAEQLFRLCLALYDKFFQTQHFEAVASIRRLCDVLARLEELDELHLTLDRAQVIVGRLRQSLGMAEMRVLKQHDASVQTIVAEAQGASQAVSGGSLWEPGEIALKTLKVLLVEDSPEDAGSVQEALSEEPIIIEWASQLSEGLEKLEDGSIDVVLLDLTLPDSTSLETLIRLQERAPSIPVVVLTGLEDRNLSIEALRHGAHDYLLKGKAQPQVLLRAIQEAVASKQSERYSKMQHEVESETSIRMIEHAPFGMLRFGQDLHVTEANLLASNLLHLSIPEMIDKALFELFPALPKRRLVRMLTNGDALRVQGVSFNGSGTFDLVLWTMRSVAADITGGVLIIEPSQQNSHEKQSSIVKALELNDDMQSLNNEIKFARALVEISQFALETNDHATVNNVTCRKLTELLGTTHSITLCWNENADHLIADSKLGWGESHEVTMWPIHDGSIAKFVLDANEAVPITDLDSEIRFEIPLSIKKQHLVSGVLVPIPGTQGPSGLLGVLTTAKRDFSESELRFIGDVAKVLGSSTINYESRQDWDEVRRLNNDLQQFAYSCAHDLQEPTRAVVSYLNLLSERYQGKFDERGERYIDVTIAAAQRLQNLICDMLEFSRVVTTGRPFEPMDTNRPLQFALRNLEDKITSTNARIETSELPKIHGDPTQLAKVFECLIDNAIKFRSQEDPEIHISCRCEAGHWIFGIKDNGIGLDMKYAERIFVIFQRLHSRKYYEGTGIGLALAKRIIERHKGRIWVESTPAAGATFYFSLPQQ